MGYVHKAFTKDRPDGIEALGKATANILDQGALYCDAHPSDYGRKLPTAPFKLGLGTVDVGRPVERTVMQAKAHRKETKHRAKVLRTRMKQQRKRLKEKKRCHPPKESSQSHSPF